MYEKRHKIQNLRTLDGSGNFNAFAIFNVGKSKPTTHMTEELKVDQDAKTMHYSYKVMGKERRLHHWALVGGGTAYIDMHRYKRCECGVLLYFALDDDNKQITVHKTVNAYAKHGKMCDKKKHG